MLRGYAARTASGLRSGLHARRRCRAARGLSHAVTNQLWRAADGWWLVASPVAPAFTRAVGGGRTTDRHAGWSPSGTATRSRHGDPGCAGLGRRTSSGDREPDGPVAG